MPTVSPSYSMKGVLNPYYTMDPATNLSTKNLLKKVGIDVETKDIFSALTQITSASFKYSLTSSS